MEGESGMRRNRASTKVSLLVAAAVIATIVPTGGVAASQGSTAQSQSHAILQSRLGNCSFTIGIHLGWSGWAAQSYIVTTNCQGYEVFLAYAWQTSYGWEIGMFDNPKAITRYNETTWSDLWFPCPVAGYIVEGAVSIAGGGYNWTRFRSSYWIACTPRV
jgi:hypothetical protein